MSQQVFGKASVEPSVETSVKSPEAVLKALGGTAQMILAKAEPEGVISAYIDTRRFLRHRARARPARGESGS